MEQWALQLRPTQFLTPTPAYAWVELANPDAGGLYLPITGWFPASADQQQDIEQALSSIVAELKGTSGSTLPWTVVTDGGLKAVSLPQKAVEPATRNSWFINLCCLQITLGQLVALLYCYPALSVLRRYLFPDLQRTAYSSTTDNLGAWHMQLKTASTVANAFTRAEALAFRSKIMLLPSWELVLVKRAGDNDVPTLLSACGELYRPFSQLYPAPVLPPSGQTCEAQRSAACYESSPDDCFARNNYPLAR
jgi:hypothetical protein